MFYRHAELKSLRHNPFNISQENRTPVCLYARKKWLGLENTLQWKSDHQKTVSELFRGQCENGSWNNSLVLGVHRLFGLHLTVRNINSRIEKALTWLLAWDFFIIFDHFLKSKKSKSIRQSMHWHMSILRMQILSSGEPFRHSSPCNKETEPGERDTKNGTHFSSSMP
jgi:hypothetical protein